ncbi:cytochrome C oxidase subunit II [Thermoproteus uzoniensis 768-20]|uniref:Cytochrome C oxidase subunit II n=1 Tax=Thermoproteus uzoniensis (strain 768-20) TaxID=999630 RepID=F2L6F7_THEU7|nr:cupredoxin domain-containing protein [Thermoproteus uzoniensis]AEA12553.1 cytochrome C oxidase subunit II [Thermoproteus uzoniensis 768-20]
MEKAKIFEYATIFGAAAVLAYLATAAGINLYYIDNYGNVYSHQPYETIKVIARQYVWEFQYPNGTTSFNTLVIKAGQLYRLELTSADVVHAFYVPDLGIKYQAVPGFVYTIWLKVDKPGTYLVECAVYCGPGHYLMLGKIVVEP